MSQNNPPLKYSAYAKNGTMEYLLLLLYPDLQHRVLPVEILLLKALQFSTCY